VNELRYTLDSLEKSRKKETNHSIVRFIWRQKNLE
jgi:hypothetical protein